MNLFPGQMSMKGTTLSNIHIMNYPIALDM